MKIGPFSRTLKWDEEGKRVREIRGRPRRLRLLLGQGQKATRDGLFWTLIASHFIAEGQAGERDGDFANLGNGEREQI